MKKTIFWALILTVSFLFVELFPKNAEAIPAFARKYKTTCITCHATFPRLTALGEAIRLNGFKMPDGDELYVKDIPLSMGVEAYKKVFPQAVWPSDIPWMPPIAIRVLQDVEFDTGGTKDSSTTFNTPEAKILSAGSLGKDMSFFVELGFKEAELKVEVEHEAGEHAEVETEFESGTELFAWLMWEDWFSNAIGENHLNFRIGSIGMQDQALPNTRSHNRITREGYLYADELLLHAHGSSNLGIEFNGFDKWWRYNIGLMQGDGATDKKDFYGALSFKIGGLGYDGSSGTTEEGGLETTPSGYWRDDSVLFGIFGKRSYVGDDDEEFDRIGADVRVNYKDLSLAGGYIRGIDVKEAAHGGGHGEGMEEGDIDKDIWFAELEYFIYPWLQPYIRYEHVSVDGADNEDKARIIAGTVMLARANVKFNLEGRFYTKNEPLADKNDDNRIFIRLDYAL
jgi:hypothetical protein